MIVIEGMDGTGKSTLAVKLADMLGYEVRRLGPKPSNDDEERRILLEQDELFKLGNAAKFVQDRATCISQPVYQRKMFDYQYAKFRRNLGKSKTILIYCRPSDETVLSLQNHKMEEYDDPEQVKFVSENAELLLKSYDDIMSRMNCFRYNYNIDSVESLVSRFEHRL